MFLVDDEEVIAGNLLRREPDRGAQPNRARVSYLVGASLDRMCTGQGLAVVRASAWADVVKRAVAAVELRP